MVKLLHAAEGINVDKTDPTPADEERALVEETISTPVDETDPTPADEEERVLVGETILMLVDESNPTPADEEEQALVEETISTLLHETEPTLVDETELLEKGLASKSLPHRIGDFCEGLHLQNPDPDYDIMSIVSDRDEIGSRFAVKRTPQEIVAEEYLGILLAQNEALEPLFEKAFARIEKHRFVENLRRLLKRYYLDLSRHAENNLERATIHLLRTRWSRRRIAQRLQTEGCKRKASDSFITRDLHASSYQLETVG
jgi:hypothetical protein